MKNKIGRIKRGIAVVLSIITMFSVLSFSGGRYLQTSLQAFAAAETEAVVIKPTYTPKFDKETYQKLLKQLNANLKKKKFSKLANKLLRDLLKNEVRHYPQWKLVNKDLPKMYDYIKDNLIDVIPLIGKIKLIDLNTEVGKRRRAKVDWVGLTVTSGNFSNISLFYDLSDEDMTDYEYAMQLSNLAHEIRHVRDREAILHTKFPTQTVEDVFLEGGPSFIERVCLPMGTEQDTNDVLEVDDDNEIFYDREGFCGYPYFSCFYDGLVYMAGYRTVNEVGKGKNPITVKKAIAKRYGESTANEIWRILLKLPYNPEKSKNPKATFKLNAKFFRLVMDCAKKDIRSLDARDKKAVRKYMDVFRNLKVKIIPYFIQDGTFATPELCGVDSVEELLIDKVLASKALPTIYDNRALNRQAVEEILYYNDLEYKAWIFTEFLPPTIAQTEYTFTYSEGEGVLTMDFTNERDLEVLFDCTFDEYGNNDRECSYPNF